MNVEQVSSNPMHDKLVVFETKVEASDTPDIFWDEAISLAREEEALGVTDKYYPDLSVDEIVSFGETLKNLPTIGEKYRQMMQKTTGGKIWYDVLLGDGNSALFSLTRKIIKEQTDEFGKFEMAIDIGTGTGNTLREISPYCQKVVGVDLADFALKEARGIGLPPNAMIVNGDAKHIPLESESVGLVVGNGLVYYFSPEETADYVREVRRLLRPGGKLYHSLHFKDKDEIVPRLSKEVLESAKVALVDIASRIATEGGHPEGLSVIKYTELLLASGFVITNYLQEKENNTGVIEYTSL